MGKLIYEAQIVDYSKEEVKKNGVYLIYHISKPNIFYIGSADRNKKGCYGRWVEHLSSLRRGIHHSIYLQRTVDKYGMEGLRFKLIETLEEGIREREKFYIDKYDSFKTGYNVSEQTSHPTLSEEGKEKISRRMTKNNPMHHKDVLERMIKTRMKMYPAWKILQYSTKGKFLKEWNNINEIGEKLKVHSSNIFRAIRGETKTSAGYIWIYKHEFTEELLKLKLEYFNSEYKQSKETIEKRSKSQQKEVEQYNKKGELLKTFNSVKEAGDKLGVDSSNISRCCTGKAKSCKGFIWKYKK